MILFSLLGAAGNLSGQISIDDAVKTALQCNPRLKAARSQVAIAQARLIDAGKLENPVFEFSLTSQTADGPEREGAIFMGYSQKFPITAKLLLQRDLGVVDIKLACAEIREVEREFIRNVLDLYIDAVGAKAQADALRRLENDVNEYIRLATSQLEKALGSELDVDAAKTESLLAAQSRTLAECDYREAIAALKPLLGMCTTDHLTLSDSLAVATRKLRKSVTMSVPEKLDRADIIAAEVRLERACVRESLARAESVEDWEIEAGYESGRSVDEPVGVERERFLNLGVKIPLPVRKKGAGIIAEAAAQKQQAAHELTAVKAAARGEVATSIEALCRSGETIETLEGRVIPLLRQREKKTRDAWQQGLVNFNDVILLQQQQSRTSETLTEALKEQAHGLVRLQFALGSNPVLCPWNPCACPTYRPGTEPENAPFALPVAARSTQAVPVATPVASPPKSNQPFREFRRKSRN
ncbi:MAG: TolC family protein [Verrucomicrobiales bacterium]|nr:TolC family protein [Verrucomicrobiales bacterium]